LDDDKDALQYAVVEFESALSAALEEDNSGDTYRDVFWAYHERVSDALEEAARSAGWTFLEDVIDTHDPTEDDEISLVTPAVGNAVGRNLIRTRLTDDVCRTDDGRSLVLHVSSASISSRKAGRFEWFCFRCATNASNSSSNPNSRISSRYSTTV
jgi:hypothetical protein